MTRPNHDGGSEAVHEYAKAEPGNLENSIWWPKPFSKLRPRSCGAVCASAQVHILNFFELQIVMGISRFRKNPDFATVERA